MGMWVASFLSSDSWSLHPLAGSRSVKTDVQVIVCTLGWNGVVCCWSLQSAGSCAMCAFSHWGTELSLPQRSKQLESQCPCLCPVLLEYCFQPFPPSLPRPRPRKHDDCGFETEHACPPPQQSPVIRGLGARPGFPPEHSLSPERLYLMRKM